MDGPQACLRMLSNLASWVSKRRAPFKKKGAVNVVIRATVPGAALRQDSAHILHRQ